MKNNKRRLLHPGFVTCCLLIVLLSACDDGYQASVRSIWFYYYGDEEEINIIKDDDLIPIPSGKVGKSLYVNCDIPSSLKEISLTFTYNSSVLEVEGFDYYIDEDDEKPAADGTVSQTLKKIDINDLTSIEIKVKAKQTADPTAFPEIAVTVEPGGHKAVCKFTIE